MKDNVLDTPTGQGCKPADIGNRIQTLRKAAQMTQTELGEVAGVSDRHIRNVEHGQCGASIEMLAKLSAFFNVSLDYIITGKSFPNISGIKKEIHFLTQHMAILEKMLK